MKKSISAILGLFMIFNLVACGTQAKEEYVTFDLNKISEFSVATIKDIKEKEVKEENPNNNDETPPVNNEVDGNVASGGTAGGATNKPPTSSNTGGTTKPVSPTPGGNTGGTTPPPVKPSEPIVQLTPTPLGGEVFDTFEEASNWARSIFYNESGGIEYAQKFGYDYISNYVTRQIAFGYASTGEVVTVKYSVMWTFVNFE